MHANPSSVNDNKNCWLSCGTFIAWVLGVSYLAGMENMSTLAGTRTLHPIFDLNPALWKPT